MLLESFAQAIYFAPRGKKRLMRLGNQLAQRYLDPEDLLIGLIGDAGAGKSLLIRGMFPGLTLTNDDSGINIRPLPVLSDVEEEDFSSHTYHVDVRFEQAFHQPWELASAVEEAVQNGKRVVIEHYELIADQIDWRADLLIGVGEEVLVTKPSVFGPTPEEIKEIVFKSIVNRRMAHTCEDLTIQVLEGMGIEHEERHHHSDIKSGFVLQFEEEIDIDEGKVEAEVKQYIDRDIPVEPHDENQIKVGETVYPCTGPRIHVRSTGEIEGFRLKKLRYDSKSGLYLLAGLVGEERSQFELSHT